MSLDYEKQLEADIDRELKGLPELRAPAGLVPRVMQSIEARLAAPWYRRSWATWPDVWRLVSFVLLATIFGALCFAAWHVPRTSGFAALFHEVAGWFSGVRAVWDATNAILAAAILVLKKLGTGFLIGCGAAVVLAWMTCVGLGTAFVRLAWVRR